MSRQSTLLSASSTINGHALEITQTDPSKSSASVASSYRQTISLKPQDDSTVVDPDELFTKHTIPEVRVVQNRLRAKAEQKKQELRLMVGERYRDVLQASASIISIAESSKNVLEVLEENRAIVSRQQAPPAVKGVLSQTDKDTHLHALQQLAAHVKILIDAPENLWRLIESKKYFSAAWLFLLVRVVHRTLVRDNEREDIIWRQQGIDVLSEFPLVQRQWDIISQFRPQIVHKATLSLRDLEVPPEDACAALVTLHLLDSRPLTETFSVYLSQRTKTLMNALSLEPQNQELGTLLANGHASHPGSPPFAAISRTSLLQDVREAVRVALLVVTHTVTSVRAIFEREDSGPSLMYTLLKGMQPNGVEYSTALPSELVLTTPSILATLPSSIQLQFLSPDLKDYRPYLDLDSSSSMVSHVHLTTKLDEWHSMAIGKLEKTFQQWLERLQSVKDVWNVRSSVWKWVSSSHLRAQETSLTLNTMDNVFRLRILGLWRGALRKAQDGFKEQLNLAVVSIGQQNDNNRADLPVDYLFRPRSLPQNSQLGLGSKTNPFEKHYSALRKSLLYRTHLLDGVLGVLESCVRTIQEDIYVIMSAGPRDLIKCLIAEYRPLAQSMCESVLQILDEAEESLPGSAGQCLAFISQVTDGLTSTSCFLTLTGCSPDIAQGFRHKLVEFYDKITDRWRHYAVSSSLEYAKTEVNSLPSSLGLLKPTGPSSGLLRSLGRLSELTSQLGLPRDPEKRKILVERTLQLFVLQYLQGAVQVSEGQGKDDLAFLHQIVKRYGESWRELRSELLNVKFPNQEKIMEETLIRHQNLIAPLLFYSLPDRLPADKQGFLLPLGIPTPDTQYQSPISASKPGPRLGQLMVEGTFSF